MADGMTPRLMEPRDVARSLGVKAATVRRWANQGVLRTVRTPGGHRRYLAEDVERMREAEHRG